MDENPSSVSQASVSPEHKYDQSVIAMAEVPALSPQSALSAESPQTTLPTMFAIQYSPPKADSPLK